MSKEITSSQQLSSELLSAAIELSEHDLDVVTGGTGNVSIGRDNNGSIGDHSINTGAYKVKNSSHYYSPRY